MNVLPGLWLSFSFGFLVVTYSYRSDRAAAGELFLLFLCYSHLDEPGSHGAYQGTRGAAGSLRTGPTAGGRHAESPGGKGL